MPVLRWLKKWIETLDLLPEYFTSAIGQWQAVLWGVSTPALVWGIWFIVGTPPQWMNVTAVFLGLFMAGYYVWCADHVRLQQKIVVPRVHQQDPFVHQESGKMAVAYFFDVINKSEALTVADVQVFLKEIRPEVIGMSNYLPMLLFQKHDNDPGPRAQKFDLNPGGIKQIDVVDGIDGNDYFNVRLITPGANTRVPTAGVHRLLVEITAKDIPKEQAQFEVWTDKLGRLHCDLI
jgi:hypothetical protein